MPWKRRVVMYFGPAGLEEFAVLALGLGDDLAVVRVALLDRLVDEFRAGLAQKLFVAVAEQLVVTLDVLDRDQQRTVVEDALEPAGAFLEGDFRLFTLREVVDLADEVKRLFFRIPDQADAQQAPDRVALLVEIALLHLVGGNLTGQRLFEVGEVFLEVVRMGDRLEVSRQQFFFAVADDLAERAVHLQQFPVEVDEGEAMRSRLEGAAEAFLAFAERFLGAHLFRQIGDGRKQGHVAFAIGLNRAYLLDAYTH